MGSSFWLEMTIEPLLIPLIDSSQREVSIAEILRVPSQARWGAGITFPKPKDSEHLCPRRVERAVQYGSMEYGSLPGRETQSMSSAPLITHVNLIID